MCHFITATLPRDVDVDAVAARFHAHGRGFAEVSNPHVAAQIAPGDRYLTTTAAHCDCGTSLGALARSEATGPATLDRQIEKLRRRGWGAARIGRWQAQTEQDPARRRREEQTAARGEAHDVAQWTDLLRELLDSGLTPRIGLLLHWYRGNLRSERISLNGIQRLAISALTPRQLMRIEEDTLYEFTV